MSEEAVKEAAAPVVPAKPRRKAKPRAPAKVIPLKVPEEFAGMTEMECCASCNADKCAISGVNACGHPFKGGQLPRHDSAALARFERAKKVLAHRKIDLRNQ